MPKTPMPSPSRKSENGLAIIRQIKTIKTQQFAEASILMQIQTKNNLDTALPPESI
jgi:hypothetical protein